jgi:flagellar protein FliO/FliZ
MRFTAVILAALVCLGANAVEMEKTSDEALVQAAEKLIKEGSVTEAKATPLNAASTEAPASAEAAKTVVTSTPAAPGKEAKESDIPVFLTSTNGEKSGSNVLWRLVASLALLLVVAGGVTFAMRRWGRSRDKGGKTARIDIMHQLHLGPRKSLALVRVSGEAMLIGVTDHNINMIKQVTLIDDELEGVLNKDFNGFLEDEFSIEDVRSALNSRV